jgi:hypothetical protein
VKQVPPVVVFVTTVVVNGVVVCVVVGVDGVVFGVVTFVVYSHGTHFAFGQHSS